jgi:methylated-DNA-[protein]-cysteine S-methyltransferase
MNYEGSRRVGEETGDGRVSGLLREAAPRLTPRGDPNRLVERIVARGTDRMFSCDSPLGEIYVGASDKGVRLVGRAASPEQFALRYRERFGRLLSWGTDARTRRLSERMAVALTGGKIEVPVDLSETTPFQRRVLEVVAGIPRGEVRPYVWVAREAGSPKASRAVGTVMANNPVPLLVPCHRVVRNDGTTGRYAFGVKEKVGLLEAEGVSVGELAGSPYLGTPTTGIVCHATCRNARRVRPENRRPFRSVNDATAAGYRPCRVCRPAVGTEISEHGPAGR